MLSPDFREFVQLLEKHNAEYLVVGGYAVGIHGRPRYTGDLDVWVNPTSVNAKNVLNAVNDFGFSSYGLTISDFETKGNIIQLGYPPLRIDIITDIDGVDFDECYKNRKPIILDGLSVNFIGFDDLVKNKKASGRYRDLDDLRNLRK